MAATAKAVATRRVFNPLRYGPRRNIVVTRRDDDDSAGIALSDTTRRRRRTPRVFTCGVASSDQCECETRRGPPVKRRQTHAAAVFLFFTRTTHENGVQHVLTENVRPSFGVFDLFRSRRKRKRTVHGSFLAIHDGPANKPYSECRTIRRTIKNIVRRTRGKRKRVRASDAACRNANTEYFF